ncbi:DUF1549 and DUF1553 domain-containing protein [Blastopirellula sp. J2-11]|uniref:DUF1549 and DUF1553 domain-containing protein n=1 Tax=Blastopirellula sp. J2-11 TaxID=2943192 RepID=UPI0021CAA9E3|nr:DUF1549 and DUF1553 domain-containing protein [Blastopirellula sp. J2-11]UUO04567.1 DUF1549 and DUF1553 domain-containing protein [Blastopirellula sp. J2-11]
MNQRSLTTTVALLIALGGGLLVMADPPSASELAKRIDQHLSAAQESSRITPTMISSDAEFLRRIYLDLAGRIPTVAETNKFLQSDEEDKRTKLAHQLVHSGAHARHMATFWRRTWIPQADTPEFRGLSEEFEVWLTMQLTSGLHYDEIVRQMLTVGASGDQAEANRVLLSTPESFLSASQRQPENLAANTTRAFLGVNLDCAQCHDHPFSRWTQEQFWETAAFFARPKSSEAVSTSDFEISMPETEKQVQATLFTGDEIPWPTQMYGDSGRTALADWVTQSENPYFARNAVNRVWANFLGTGLVEPLDDLSEENPPVHPEILEELANAFVTSEFDLKLLTEAIVLTEAYQRSSRVSVGESAQVDPTLYARMPVRGLSGEQLYDSIRTAAGLPIERNDLDPTKDRDARERFTTKFFVEDASHAERSILQSLSLMNGEATQEIVQADESPLLRTLADAPFLNDQEKVRTLYMAMLSRDPRPEEAETFARYLAAAPDKGAALGDLMWALLNSAEFNTNH